MDEPRSTEQALSIIDRFESLPVERRVEIFRKLSPQSREELIRTVSKPGEIVRRISEEETYFSIKQLGEENAPALIAATTGRQLRYLLDLDLWEKDRIDLAAAVRWMQIIADTSIEKVLQFIQIADEELLLTILHRLVRVEVRDADVDLTEQREALPGFTLDEIFFIEFLAPPLEETIKRFLEAVFQWKSELYVTLMQGLVWAVQPENEENAWKWRRARLEDHGFPDFDEALSVYQYLKPGASVVPADATGQEEESFGPGSLVAYPLKVLDTETFLRACLNRIEDGVEKDRISMGLAHLANKVVVADGKHPGVDAITAAVKKVSGYINIALEQDCGADVSCGAHALGATHVEILFRRGFSAVLDLRKQALERIREYEGGADNLGFPLAELVKGVLRKRPLYAANVLGEGRARDFQSLEEIESIKRMMEPGALESRWEDL